MAPELRRAPLRGPDSKLCCASSIIANSQYIWVHGLCVRARVGPRNHFIFHPPCLCAHVHPLETIPAALFRSPRSVGGRESLRDSPALQGHIRVAPAFLCIQRRASPPPLRACARVCLEAFAKERLHRCFARCELGGGTDVYTRRFPDAVRESVARREGAAQLLGFRRGT